jgi:uncharacterized phage protein (TIGR01671 family)
MRQLKFRTWHTELGRYLKDNEFYINPDGSVYSEFESYNNKIRKTNYIENFSRDDFDEGYIIVEQYTGLKDKNGKEIYEGDIVEYDWYIRNDKSYRVKEKVVFDDMGARLGNDRIRNCSNVEVIGNIHENLDLLEEKK